MEEKIRCTWCLSSNLYKEYHDKEWGKPVYDDATLFEFLLLETFQAGLSWITILNKRENFRTAFDHFDYKKIAAYSDAKILSLLEDSGIIRNKLKVNSAITNAQAFMNIQEQYGSFSTYIWNFVYGKPIDILPVTNRDVPATTPLSDTISKDLKTRGFKFVGSTVIYAFLQATGIVNDHTQECWTRNDLNII
ncbi:DNA-3-methyladenine glycosylase I [Flavobacterium algicola]|uniref:DNA-3-methyladenine glycosylase I n=1 Tax=Flavobacterium algicola TaxID=556529 RepID=UPI001EFDE321|nr:DNA-3-methyladenine glycosylase I [Flavobacterium algicola]MCG9791564.1 DNA-3-methyladenine glycosylase I [Flavobacterium algicola]